MGPISQHLMEQTIIELCIQNTVNWDDTNTFTRVTKNDFYLLLGHFMETVAQYMVVL